jgi:hypothetical protein
MKQIGVRLAVPLFMCSTSTGHGAAVDLDSVQAGDVVPGQIQVGARHGSSSCLVALGAKAREGLQPPTCAAHRWSRRT